MIHLVFIKVTKYLLIQHQKLKFFQHKHASGDARQPKVDKMNGEDKKTIKNLIDAFITKGKLKQLAL